MTEKLRRSALYMPGTNIRALEKARTLKADAILMDLEDSVLPVEKETARKNISRAIAEGGYGEREMIIRINPLDSEWGGADLEMAVASSANAVLLPKVESAHDIETLARAIESGSENDKTIWLMVETARALLDLDQLASTSPLVDCLVLGLEDLAMQTRIPSTPDRIGMLPCLTHAVLVARANGIDVLDGVCTDINHTAEYLLQCQQSRDLGFDGKTLIHPNQIRVANSLFSPDEEAIDLAKRLIINFETARSEGKGVTVVDGKLVEHLHVLEARRIMAMAKAIRKRNN